MPGRRKRKKNYKRTSCQKRYLSKCFDDAVKTYNQLESKYADMLQGDSEVRSFRCNVLLPDFPEGEYCSDFVVTMLNGNLAVRECVFRKYMGKPKTLKLLGASHDYWARRGVTDWAIVIDKEGRDDNEKTSAE